MQKGVSMQKGRQTTLRRPATVFAMGVAACLVLAACGTNTSGAAAGLHAPERPAGAPAASGTLRLDLGSPWGTSWSFNPYNPNFPLMGGAIDLPLAIQNPPVMTDYIPQLASSWKAHGHQLLVHLRPDAKWQNGQALTSKDVADTIVLDGTEGAAIWNDIDGIATPSSHEIVLTVRNGVPVATAEQDLFNGVTPYPAGEYGRFVTPGLEHEEVAYYDEDQTNPTAAANSSDKAAMNNAFTALSKFAPKTLIGDGPFKLRAINSVEAKLSKWGGFYDASKIHIKQLEFLKGGTQNVYPILDGQQADLSWSYMPPAVVSRYLQTPNAHMALEPRQEFVIEFNDHAYPLDITKVRQALAYVIPRKKIITLTYGTHDAGGALATHPDGLSPSIQGLWLTKRQIDSLNTYPVNLSKAAKLLESVGFHRTKGQWIMPNGHPFKLNAIVSSSFSDVVTAFDVTGTSLSNFGIKTQVTAAASTAAETDFYDGNYDLAWGQPDSLNPLDEFDQMLGTSDNFPTLGTYKGQRALGYGPTASVPGLGRIQVPQTIDAEAAKTAPGKKMKQLTWDWARLVNTQVPYLEYGYKMNQIEYLTSRFDHWPPTSNAAFKSLYYNDLALMLEDGYVRQKR